MLNTDGTCKQTGPHIKKIRSPYEFIYTIIKVHKYSGNTNEVFWDIVTNTQVYRDILTIFSAGDGEI